MNYHERDIYGIYNNPQFAPPLVANGPGPHLMGAETLIGNAVLNRSGQTLGDIKEIMLEVETGRVGYAVLSFSTYFGLSEKLFAVPWKMLTLDPLQKCFVMDLSPERLVTKPTRVLRELRSVDIVFDPRIRGAPLRRPSGS